jgi:acid phosphatase type 7
MKLLNTRWIAGAGLLLFAIGCRGDKPFKRADANFWVKPYIQLGQSSTIGSMDSLAVMWLADDKDADWTLDVKRQNDTQWAAMSAPTYARVAVEGPQPHRVYKAYAVNLPLGAKFSYRVSVDGKEAFVGEAQARKPATAPFRTVVFGDCAADTTDQRAIASLAHQQNADMILITGDIVYSRGRSSEYLSHYFPVYNADKADSKIGAPLSRSTLMVAAPGNHDILTTDIEKYPDTQAFFYYWAHPLNGIERKFGDASTPVLKGSAAKISAFQAAAGANFPRMANYSFDYGNAHWLILDSNPYVDTTSPALIKWIADDLKRSKADWKFVAYHHPDFQSSKAHQQDQWMRLLASTFEKNGVSIVFNGHVHNYQRSHPLKFTPQPGKNGLLRQKDGTVDGLISLDKTYDGVNVTKLNGVMYVVTGAGGAKLYNPELNDAPRRWKSFTRSYVADTHSLTVMDINGKSLTIRQVAANGKELDRFTVTK